MATAMPGIPVLFISGASDSADGGLDTGCRAPQPVNAGKTTAKAAVAEHLVMAANFSPSGYPLRAATTG